MLKLHDMPMRRYKVIAIKSSQHFRAFFEAAAAGIVTVDTPGISTFDFGTFASGHPPATSIRWAEGEAKPGPAGPASRGMVGTLQQDRYARAGVLFQGQVDIA